MDNAKKIEDALEPILMAVVKIGSAFMTITGNALKGIVAIIEPIIDVLKNANDKTDGWIGKIALLTIAWKAFNLSFLLSPLGLLLSLGVAVGLLVDDFYEFTQGRDTLIDWGGTTGTVLLNTATGIAIVGSALLITKGIMTAYSVATKLASAATLIFNMLFRATPFGLFITGVAALIGAGYLLIHNWDKVKQWFNEFFGWFEKKGEMIANIASKISSGLGNSFHTLENKVLGVGGAASSNVVNQTTTVHVNGAQSPQATAQAVATHQTQVNAQITRNMTARAR